jgi:hypothetical protein
LGKFRSALGCSAHPVIWKRETPDQKDSSNKEVWSQQGWEEEDGHHDCVLARGRAALIGPGGESEEKE